MTTKPAPDLRQRVAAFIERTRTRAAELDLARRRRGWVFPVKLRSGQSRLFLVLLATLAGLAGALAWGITYLTPVSPGQEIRISDLANLAKNGQVHDATFYDFDHRVTGTYSADGQPHVYWTTYFQTDAESPYLLDRLTAGGAQVRIRNQTDKTIIQYGTEYILPLVMLANLFAIIFIAARGGGGDALGGIAEFGSIGKKRGGKTSINRITFADVAGADEAVTELREVRDYLRDPARFAAMGAAPPKGVLMFGPPGCGKTLMARAVAGEADVPFFSISGAEFVESLVGIGAARVRDLFRKVREVAPAILFIDELDAAGRRRGGVTGGQEEREQTLNQLLIEMDGFNPTAGIVVMGATNRPDILDPALLRPGRFDRQVTVEPPDIGGREAILQLYALRRPIDPDIDFHLLAKRTPGFTGADLANVVNEAALLCVRFGTPALTMAEMEEAVQRVLSGPKRRGHLMTPEERKRAAYHESGHALVSAAMGRIADTHRLSIIARGRSGGQTTVNKSWQERTLLTRSELRGELITVLGGSVAEELTFGEPSTGARDDVRRATELAQLMAGEFGMSERLGKVWLIRTDGNEFLGGDAIPTELTAGSVLTELHTEVRTLIREAEDVGRRILTEHRTVLVALADRLEEEESIEAADLHVILDPVRPERNLEQVTAITGVGNGHGASAPQPVER